MPVGYSPFNIQNLNGRIYVTYTQQQSSGGPPDRGYAHRENSSATGYVSIFDLSGKLLGHLNAPGSTLNAPWGMAIAPANFGDFGGALLVGNFNDGRIHAFDPNSGQLLGTLYDQANRPLAIPGLWALLFGNGKSGGDSGTLYFSAGATGKSGESIQSHGLFGSIQAAPNFSLSSVVNAADGSTNLAANTWISVFGQGLAAGTGPWQDSDFVNDHLPTQLAGVGVTLNGEPAYVSYVSPGQINFLAPPDIAAGPVQLVITNNGQASAPVTATFQAAAPAFFMFPGNKYIAATHSDGTTLAGPSGLIPGATTTPLASGETVVLYANGFGPTTPAVPNGQLVTTALPLVNAPSVTIGGQPANVTFAGLSATGLYQINAVVPKLAGSGAALDAAVSAQMPGGQSQTNAFLSVLSTATPTSTAVRVANFTFSPTPVTITAGSGVTWTNQDAAQHSIASDTNLFQSAALDTGTQFSQTLNTPGTYKYHCGIHPGMKGTIIVQ